MAYLAPNLHGWDLPWLLEPRRVVVVDSALENLGHLVVLEDAMQLSARRRLFLRVLEHSIM